MTFFDLMNISIRRYMKFINCMEMLNNDTSIGIRYSIIQFKIINIRTRIYHLRSVKNSKFTVSGKFVPHCSIRFYNDLEHGYVNKNLVSQSNYLMRVNPTPRRYDDLIPPIYSVREYYDDLLYDYYDEYYDTVEG